jgi:plastocyanin
LIFYLINQKTGDMRKTILLLIYFLPFHSKATTWEVTVQDFQFSPSSLNVVVGDVIRWVWVSGFHTTTSSTIPSGADSWDYAIDANNLSYDYMVTAPGTYNYICYFHEAFGMVASFTATGVAPVTLSAFNINTQNKKPFLTWTTQTEVNVDYFSIRKSENGRDFKEIAKVPAAGNSATEKNYTYLDDQVSAGISYVYYALASVDKDGNTQLSPIKMYENKMAVTKLIISLSPNPVSKMGHLMLQFNAAKSGNMIATLSDMQGRIVLKTSLSADKGVNNGHIHLGGIPPGIYTISFHLDGITEAYKVEVANH